jgi:hypothetical protein
LLRHGPVLLMYSKLSRPPQRLQIYISQEDALVF